MSINKISQKVFISSLFLLLIVSCGTKEEVTCLSQGSVVNGKEIKEGSPKEWVTLEAAKDKCGAPIKMDTTFPAVVSLRTSKGICTGTFINDHTILSAAHCFSSHFNVDSKGQVDVAVSINEVKAVSTQVIINPEFYLKGKSYKYDQALVFVPKGTSKEFLKTHAGAVGLQDKIYSVGYGDNKKQDGVFGGAGKKRWGENVIHMIQNDFIRIDGTAMDVKSGEDVSLGGGDSGGPLVYKNKVLGIASNVRGNDRILSTYIRVDSVETKAFLKKAFSYYNPKLKNNQKPFLALCKNPKLQTDFYKALMAKVLRTYGLKKCEELSYRYPLYGSLDLSGVNLKKITDDGLLDGLKLFKNVRALKLNNTGLKSLNLFKEMKDLDELEIKNNPFEDFKSLDSFKNLKILQLDNPKALKSHLKPTAGLHLQGTWVSNCFYNEKKKLYEVEASHFSSSFYGLLQRFSDKECSEKVFELELKGNFNIGSVNEHYREININVNQIKVTEFKEEGEKIVELPVSLSVYDIFKVEGDKLTLGDRKGKMNNQRKFRPKHLKKGKYLFKVSK